ncbi:unnamed protein product [Ixodes pacificus]
MTLYSQLSLCTRPLKCWQLRTQWTFSQEEFCVSVQPLSTQRRKLKLRLASRRGSCATPPCLLCGSTRGEGTRGSATPIQGHQTSSFRRLVSSLYEKKSQFKWTYGLRNCDSDLK